MDLPRRGLWLFTGRTKGVPLGQKKKKREKNDQVNDRECVSKKRNRGKRASTVPSTRREIASRIGNGEQQCSVTVSMALTARDRLHIRTWRRAALDLVFCSTGSSWTPRANAELVVHDVDEPLRHRHRPSLLSQHRLAC